MSDQRNPVDPNRAAKALIAFGAVLVLLALIAFQNLYVAAGVALMFGSLVVMPSLLPSMFAALKTKVARRRRREGE